MARLSKEQWQNARETWETDERAGYEWLAKELGISRPAVAKKAGKEAWKKADKKVTQVTQKLRKKVTREKKVTQTGEIERKPVGRPTLYSEEYNDQAYKLCLLGAIDKELADFFGVDERTINNWKEDYPDFFQSLKEGKEIADMNVANSLYKSATGGHYVEYERVVNTGDGFEVIKLSKQIEPNTTSQIFWLKNRQFIKNKWRDNIDVDNNFKMDKETLEMIERDFIRVMAEAHERQRAVLIERGIVIDDLPPT